jgi:glycosyltransferase involved in cell wall biosynthesis
MDATTADASRLPRALLVSSFVLPRSGGIEQFVDIAARLLRGRGWQVRVLACRPRDARAEADATVPTRYLRPGGWPLPVGGWRTLWREVGEAEVVIANGTRHPLPNLAAFAARLRGKRVIFVLHGSGAPFSTSSLVYHRLLGSVFERLLSRPALRLSQPVSLSRAGVAGCRSRYGVDATYVPFPLRELPPPATPAPVGREKPLKIVWVGRLYGEKNPLGAVAVVERVRQEREATLEIYGSGPLLGALQELARDRPWLAVGGPRSWEEIQTIQGSAHLCLSTSLRDATQIAILEPLSRGVPVVSTRVGDALGYYARGLWPFCVEPGDPEAAAQAILALAGSYKRYRGRFDANAHELLRRHREGAQRLAELLQPQGVAAGNGISKATTRAELPVA